jgi:hypothetical protein
MLKLVVNNQEEEKQDTQPVLKLAGKGPTSPDWLSPMKSGTEFLVRNKGFSAWLLNEFTHGGKKEGAVLLIPSQTMQNTTTWIWVDPYEFCKAFELRGVLEVPDDSS